MFIEIYIKSRTYVLTTHNTENKTILKVAKMKEERKKNAILHK